MRTKTRTPRTDNYVITRERLVSKLERSYPDMFISTTEEFFGEGQSSGGVWLCGEGSDTDRNGDELFKYYADGDSNYVNGVVKHLSNFLDRNGWRGEWNDAGTLMLWLKD